MYKSRAVSLLFYKYYIFFGNKNVILLSLKNMIPRLIMSSTKSINLKTLSPKKCCVFKN